MGLDVRLPIGAMFLIAGVLLTAYGALTNGDAALYQKSLSIDINLWWGLVMAVFGAIFLSLALKAKKAGPATNPAERQDDAGPTHH